MAAATALTAHGRFGGLLRSRFPGNRMVNLTVRMQLAQQHAVFHDFPQQDQQAVFDRGDVRIETAMANRSAPDVKPAPPSPGSTDSHATFAIFLATSILHRARIPQSRAEEFSGPAYLG